MDAPVLIFTTLISVLTGPGVRPCPCFPVRRAVRATRLRQAGGRATTSRKRLGLRAGLVVAQASVSLMLLIGAGLMARSFHQTSASRSRASTRTVCLLFG